MQARRERLCRAETALRAAIAQACDPPAQRLGLLAARMHALSPVATLARGYALVHRDDGTVLRRATDAQPGMGLRVRLAEGALECRVEQVYPARTRPGSGADPSG